MLRRHRRFAVLGLAAIVLAACGGESTGTEADPRTVAIDSTDDFAFDPDEVTVQAGETIRFVVTNTGEIVHEFVLGPDDVQMAHEDAMEMGDEEHGGMQMEGQLAALVLEPGETEEAIVTFGEAGEMTFGCHEAGHYDAGMVGAVIIED